MLNGVVRCFFYHFDSRFCYVHTAETVILHGLIKVRVYITEIVLIHKVLFRYIVSTSLIVCLLRRGVFEMALSQKLCVYPSLAGLQKGGKTSSRSKLCFASRLDV